MNTTPQPRATLENIKPYTPGKSKAQAEREFGITEWVKLASNENPFGCPVSMQELEKELNDAQAYPDQSTSPLVQKIAEILSVTPTNIILGNGSDDVIQMLGLAYLNAGDTILSSDIAFSVYEHVAHLLDAKVVSSPLHEAHYDLEDMWSRVDEKTKIVFITSPHNPFGTIVPKEDIETFLKKLPRHILCVVDEAYIEFASSPSTVDLVALYPNLVVLRTFSKCYGLAGLRVGYGIADPAVIAQLQKVRQPFNVNKMALKAAELALGKSSFIAKTLRNNSEQKEILYSALEQLGIPYIKSEASFVCLTLDTPAYDCVNFLMTKGIIVRHLASFGLPNNIRVTIGTSGENQLLIQALKEFTHGKANTTIPNTSR